MMYFSLWMSSVKGARKVTFLGKGNIAVVFRLRMQPWGPLDKMEVWLKGRRYGTGLLYESMVEADEIDESVEAEVAEVADKALSVDEERGGTDVFKLRRDLGGRWVSCGVMAWGLETCCCP